MSKRKRGNPHKRRAEVSERRWTRGALSAPDGRKRRSPPGGVARVWFRPLLTVAAAVYLLLLFLGGARAGGASPSLPKTLQYFTQVACLFPHALPVAIDYRLERWDCKSQVFEEVDTAPYFPIRPDDKENRFKRLGFFHRRSRTVMEALEDHMLASPANPRTPEGRRFGGIRLVSLRLPFPPLGAPVAPYERAKLSELPSEQVKAWFFTPVSRRSMWCDGEPEPLKRWKAARSGRGAAAETAEGADE